MAARTVQRIFVGNLPWTISKHELREYFSQFGHVSMANVLFNKDTGLSRGYGFVKFSSNDGYNAAVNKELHVIDGSSVVVQPVTKNDKESELR